MKKLIPVIMLLVILAVSSYADLTDNVLYYSFDVDDVSGTTLTDLSGNSKDATCVNMASGCNSVPGLLNNATDFDGSNDYISIPKTLGLLNKDFAVSIWLNLTDDSVNQFPIDLRGEITTRMGYNDVGGTLQFKNLDTGAEIVTTDAVPLNEWFHVVIVYDLSETEGYLYINGNLNVSGDIGTIASDANALSAIGCRADTGGCADYYNMESDEVAIYNRTLTSLEVSELYNSGAGFNPYSASTPANLTFTANNVYDNSAITNFNITIDSTDYTTTTGTITTHILVNDTTLYGYGFFASGYYSKAGSVRASDTPSEQVDSYQSILNLEAYDLDGNKIQNPTFTASAQSDNETLYVNSGTIEVEFSKSGWYSANKNFTTIAKAESTQNFTGLYDTIFNITANNVYDNSAINSFNITIDGDVTTTTDGTAEIPLLSFNTYSALFQSNNYYNQTNASLDASSGTFEFDSYQAILNLEAYSVVTGDKIGNPTFTASAQSDNETIYVNAGTIQVTFSKAGWYSQNKNFTTIAKAESTQNFTGLYDSILNITALGYPGAVSLSNFSYLVTQTDNSYSLNSTSSGEQVLIQLKKGLNYTINVSKTNFFENETIYYLNDSLANLTLNLLSRVDTYFYFFDEETLQPINGVQFNVLSDQFSLSANTGAGNSYFLSTLPGSDYEIRYLTNSSDYSARSYFFRVPLISSDYANISLYGIWTNISATFVRSVVDQNSAPLQNSVLEVQRAYPSDDNSSLIYRTIEIAEIDSSGDAVFRAIPNTQAYRFRILKNFSLVDTRSPSYLIDTSSEFLVNEESELLDNFNTFRSITSNLYYQNTTEYFILDYTDSAAEVSQVCLYVSRRYGPTENLTKSCSNSASGTIMIKINSSQDGYYSANAFATIEGTDYLIDSESLRLPESNIQATFQFVTGILLIMLLVLCATLTGFINPVFPILLAIAGIAAFSLQFLGLFSIGGITLGGLLVAGGVILFLVLKN